MQKLLRLYSGGARVTQRRFASSTTPIPEHSIYVSESTDPYFNLSFEDWLFRHHPPHAPALLLYRDTPCVVIGRNQNPWKEVNFHALRNRSDEIPFIRRRSGGGTVYHDLGNTNFSIHLPRASFDRFATAKVVLRAVRSLGLDEAQVNDRNDICLQVDVGKQSTMKKVSGSAYKIVNKRAYHHGTMLISTRLDTLGDVLRTNKDTMQTKGVASVRSPVCNLTQFRPELEITHDKFVDAVINSFREEYGIPSSSPAVKVKQDKYQNIGYIQNGISELPSWEWAYGQTPEFTYTVKRGDTEATIHSKHGVILDCDLRGQIEMGAAGRIKALLVGKRYGFVTDEDVELLGQKELEVWRWLKDVMDG